MERLKFFVEKCDEKLCAIEFISADEVCVAEFFFR
jgi:hypothetical protein